MRESPSRIGKFNGRYYDDPEELLSDAQNYLAHKHGASLFLTGRVLEDFVPEQRRELIYIVETPYGTMNSSYPKCEEKEAGEFAPKESKHAYGAITYFGLEGGDRGFAIGNRVIYERENNDGQKEGAEAIVLKGNRFGSTEMDEPGGTATVLIKFIDNKKHEWVTPWSLKKVG